MFCYLPKDKSKLYRNHPYLKIPLHTQTRTALKAECRAKVIAQLNLCAYIQVVATKMAPHVIPQLWFCNKHRVLGLCHLCAVFIHSSIVRMVFKPHICKTIKRQAFKSKEVLTRPHASKLHGHLAICLNNFFVQEFQVECILIALIVQKIIYTSQPCRIDGIAFRNTAIIFNMQLKGANFVFCQKFKQRAISR